MQISVTFKHIDASEPLRTYVSEKLNKFDRYLHNPAEANVVLSVEKHRHQAEITIVGDRMAINGREETDDMYSAIDMVLDKLEKQIKKSKEKLSDKRSGARYRAKAGLTPETISVEEDFEKQIKVKNIDYKPMDVDEAIMQMQLVDDNFLVFTNARDSRVNVLYRRKDGHYGLIQPSS